MGSSEHRWVLLNIGGSSRIIDGVLLTIDWVLLTIDGSSRVIDGSC